MAFYFLAGLVTDLPRDLREINSPLSTDFGDPNDALAVKHSATRGIVANAWVGVSGMEVPCSGDTLGFEEIRNGSVEHGLEVCSGGKECSS